MPTWLLSLSIFQQYGNPVTDGMTAVAMALLVISLVQFRYADVERG